MLFLNPLYNKPNRIIEKQKLIQSDPRKIMYRLPRSQLYLGVYGASWVVGMVGTTWGIYSLIKGKQQE
ncbi:putative cytochrome c oxidase subunit VII [Lyophyllum shimeji]|uniref:Cytochrome c oxidase subunit VII n=1 Tax=Lyophyllum shimeji TaxID=47721 RepID=A0A9P3UK69_LYOSH|nr:putative cytochrome c oxidase subunit VII [Lyophyllum shimeji]